MFQDADGSVIMSLAVDSMSAYISYIILVWTSAPCTMSPLLKAAKIENSLKVSKLKTAPTIENGQNFMRAENQILGLAQRGKMNLKAAKFRSSKSPFECSQISTRSTIL